MKKVLICLFLIFFLTSLASAEIIINQKPNPAYSLGDTITLPVTIKSVTDITGSFGMDLLCNGHTINFYKNGISLKSGEEKEMSASLVLTKEIIGESKGNCKIKAMLGTDYILTDDFSVSDLIFLEVTNTEEIEVLEPGQTFLLKGSAVKDSQEDVNGFIEITLGLGNESESTTYLETIGNGFFETNIVLPQEMKAGNYLVTIKAYEKDTQDTITNQGLTNLNIYIRQIPTNLEIIFENQEVEPGTSLNVKTILHDQTGEPIESLSSLIIKNNKDKIISQEEIATDEFFELPIKNNELPAEWKVIATSNEITSESNFKITEKKSVEVEIINKTLIITNTGNVPYQDNLLVKVGEEPLNINVSLELGEIQKYVLSAPDGHYQVEIMDKTEEVFLTGKTIDVRKAAEGVGGFVKYPFVWIFMIAILGFVAFTIFKKGYKRSFFGRIIKRRPKHPGTQEEKITAVPLNTKSKIKTKSKAELSLSIKGEKQNASIVALRIKNLQEIESKKTNAGETIQQIVTLAEENKAAVYENQGLLFFILAPIKTRTFGNEKNALHIAQSAKQILEEHNKKFNQKIDYGLSINYGTIIAKKESPSLLKFMSMGTLITGAKKMTTISNKEILLGETIKEKLGRDITTEKQKRHGTEIFVVKEIKAKSEEHQRFIRQFLNKIEGKDQKKK